MNLNVIHTCKKPGSAKPISTKSPQKGEFKGIGAQNTHGYKKQKMMH